MDKNFILAISLSLLVLVGSQYLLQRFAPPPEVPEIIETEGKEIETSKTAPRANNKPLNAGPRSAPAGSRLFQSGGIETISANSENSYLVETDRFRLSLSNRGAIVKEWVLKDFRDGNGEALNLLPLNCEKADSQVRSNCEEQAKKAGFPLSLRIEKETEITEKLKTALFRFDGPPILNFSGSGSVPRKLKFEYSDGIVSVTKQLTFQADSYEIQIDSNVSINGRPVDHSLLWRGGFGDRTLNNAWAKKYVILKSQGDIERLDESDLESRRSMEGNFQTLGLEDHYFAAVFLPAGPNQIRRISLGSQGVIDYLGEEPLETILLNIGVYGSGQGVRLFVGPKDTNVLPDALDGVIDYGWFAFLCRPLLYGLKWTYSVVGNYGVAIILLTIVINVALFPLRIKSLKSSKKMQQFAPKIKEIQAKYKKMKATDPRKQRMQAEVMAFYKEKGVNPLGGCWPMLIQMPFFFAFYRLLNASIELRQAPFIFWIKDLSIPDPTYILPILMGLSMFQMQRMTPMPMAGSDPQQAMQAKLMKFMPLMFVFFMIAASSGLVLYWFTGTLISITLQAGWQGHAGGSSSGGVSGFFDWSSGSSGGSDDKSDDK
ncbi:MAG: membrane protein insertase YidC [Acidobacteriia bacterium]|nr:membrane protein insertase YidC [Terriglobia bacterium]